MSIDNKQELRIDEAWGNIPCEIKEAFWDQLTSEVTTGEDNLNLLPLSTYMLCKRFTTMHEVGVQAVVASQIKGRVGLTQDFDSIFMPRDPSIRDEWTSVDQSRFNNETLSLIKLLKINDNYFLLGDQHSFSDESIRIVESIEAFVIAVEEDTKC